MAKSKKAASISGGNILIILTFVFLVAIIGAMFGTFYQVGIHESQDKEYLLHSQEMRVLSQTLAKNAAEAANGNAEAFSLLKDSFDEVQMHVMHLRNGVDEDGNIRGMEGMKMDHSNTGGMKMDHSKMGHDEQSQREIGLTTELPPAPTEVDAELTKVEMAWSKIKPDAKIIIDSWQSVISLYEIAESFNTSIPVLQNLSAQATDLMIAAGSKQKQVFLAGRQSLLAERMARNVGLVLKGGISAVTAADGFGRNTALFGRVLSGLLKGDSRLGIVRVSNRAARAKLTEAAAVFEQVSQHVGDILKASPELFQVREAADKIFFASGAFLEDTNELENAFANLASSRFISARVGYVLGATALAFLVIGGALFMNRSRKAQQAAEEARIESEDLNERNQEAILRLLDEMSTLADGDLTVNATVTEDITGAIADSINYAIEEMRKLVRAINDTSEMVSGSADQTRATAMHLAEASEHQAQQITTASASINDVAKSIEKVSKDASSSAAVAKKSVAMAHEGAEKVRRTITSMDNIRETIQETSKRIKRLGESSQEIGAIVELINDIADQTNILALNAAIQAAMAGEAGRGFAVVADEVQRLAERSADATKQIEALIRTIQADTNEAVGSMEQSTSGVVTGAKLAEDAGVALDQIETVSRSLADLIGQISNTAASQVSAANQVTDSMHVIQDITMQTSSGTNEAAVSIGNLAEQAKDLRTSVAGFRLPGGEEFGAISGDENILDSTLTESDDFLLGDDDDLALEKMG